MQATTLIMEGGELAGMSTRKPPEPRIYREHVRKADSHNNLIGLYNGGNS